MKPRISLPTLALAAGLALSGASCKPTTDTYQQRVDHVLASAQPDVGLMHDSQSYYDGRHDLSGIDFEKKKSLVLSHAKLAMVAKKLQEGSLSIQDFLQIVLHSDVKVITDKNTKLKLEHTLGVSIGDITFGQDEWEIHTEQNSPNRIFKHPKISSVTLDGGSLTLKVVGNESNLVGDKNDVLVRTEGQEIEDHTATYTFTAKLVLAQ